MLVRTALLAILGVVGCADSETGSVDLADAPTGGNESQIAPQGHTALTAWLAAGHSLSWACEDAPHPARPPGAHGMNRICSNAALSESSRCLPLDRLQLQSETVGHDLFHRGDVDPSLLPRCIGVIKREVVGLLVVGNHVHERRRATGLESETKQER